MKIKILMTISSRCFNHHVITVHVVVPTKSLKISKYEIGLMSYGIYINIYIFIYSSNIIKYHPLYWFASAVIFHSHRRVLHYDNI